MKSGTTESADGSIARRAGPVRLGHTEAAKSALTKSAFSWKFACRILHIPSPTPLESPPPGTPHPRGSPGADLCLLRWMGVLGSAETEDRDEMIEAGPCC